MPLRTKLFAIFTLAVLATVGIMAWSVDRYAQRQIQESDQQHSAALVAQFQRELAQRGAEVSASVQGIADAESTLRMVLDLNRPQADPSVYVHDARGLAASHQLDFLELAGSDGTLISSAQWPERVGYKDNLVTQQSDWSQEPAFLNRVEMSDRVDLGLMAVRMVRAGNKSFYIVGGRRLDSEFLRNLAMPAGMRALFYRNLEQTFVPASLVDAEGPLAGAESFAPLVESLQKQPAGSEKTIEWTADSGAPERFISLPLRGRQGEMLAALLVGSAQGQLVALQTYIRGLALAVAAAGIFLGFIVSWWIGARVNRPLAQLAEGMAEVSAGDWDAQVKSGATPEVRRVLGAFNRMTTGLSEERAAHIARERAAAGRELAAQLAGELKSSLAPFEQAMQSLHRLAAPAAGHSDASIRTDAVDEQPLPALGHSLEALEATSGRLKEFASLPAPRLEAVNLGEVVRAGVQALSPRFGAIGRPPVTPELFLDERMAPVRADAGLLRKALDILLLFLVDDMPAGGTLTIRVRQQGGMAHMILSDTGVGTFFEAQDPARPLSPYRSARAPGAALKLATVQSIVSGHAGKISIESARGTGITFILDLPSEALAPLVRPEPKAEPVAAKPVSLEDDWMPQEPHHAPATADEPQQSAIADRTEEDKDEEEPPLPLEIPVEPEMSEEMFLESLPEGEVVELDSPDDPEEENWSALAQVLHEAQIRLASEVPEQDPEIFYYPITGINRIENSTPEVDRDSIQPQGPEPDREIEENLYLVTEMQAVPAKPDGNHERVPELSGDPAPVAPVELSHAPHAALDLEPSPEKSEAEKTAAEIESKRIWMTYR